MRGFVPEFSLHREPSFAATMQLLRDHPGRYKPFAGGTDLMVLFESGVLRHREFVDISRFSELHDIRVSDTWIEIGACETYTNIQHHPVIRSEFPSLAQAGSETGGLAIQNRGTIGGNIANASPAADSPPALLAYGAELVLASASGQRLVGYDQFHKGYKVMDLKPDELIVAVRLPRRSPDPGKVVHFYQKAGTRRAQAISKVVFCGFAVTVGGIVREVRCAIGSVGPVTIRCQQVEQALAGKVVDQKIEQTAVDALLREISPMDDIRSNKEFRNDVSVNLLRKFLRELR